MGAGKYITQARGALTYGARVLRRAALFAYFVLATAASTPLLVFAQPSPQQSAAQETALFVMRFNNIILYPLIALLMGVALLVFLYGAAQYVMNPTNETVRSEARQHMLYGILGLVVMVAAVAILMIFLRTFGLERAYECANNPQLPGCEDVFKLR
jgi:cytochrome bd-type quinol oxidase subunit 2